MSDADAPITDPPAADPPAPPAAPPARLRLALLSEVAYAKGEAEARPIHALRAGTFTDMSGRETTFTAEDIRGIAERLNATAQRRRPPINERHDYGRAVGRMLSAVTRYNDTHLYITPRWNAEGRRLLEEEAYDGFSIELEPAGKDGYVGAWAAIGGGLTNYPAVSNLAPVTLSAPPPDLPTPAPETAPMSDTPDVAPQATPDLPPLPAPVGDDPIVAQQVAAYAAQIQAQFRAQHETVLRQAQEQALAQFERWKAEQAAQQAILTFAQHVTTATIDRPHALAYTSEQVAAILTGLSGEKRQAVQQFMTDVVEGKALIAFDALGGQGEGADDDAPDAIRARWSKAIADRTARGLSQSAAIVAVRRDDPGLYEAYNALGARKGGR